MPISFEDQSSLMMVSPDHHLQKWQTDTYNLCRTTASEILVFMANDLDRKYHPEIANAHLHVIAYAMKGSSMTNDCFRSMLQYVIERCQEQGLNELSTSADGQWHHFCVKNWNDEPRSILQLQRDVWNREKSKTKSTILSYVKNLLVVKHGTDVTAEKKSGVLYVYGHSNEEKINVYQGPKKRYTEKKSSTINTNVSVHSFNRYGTSVKEVNHCTENIIHHVTLHRDNGNFQENAKMTGNVGNDIFQMGNGFIYSFDKYM